MLYKYQPRSGWIILKTNGHIYPNSDRLIEYVKNQEEHHKTKSFREEIKELLIEQGIEFDEKYLLWNIQPLRGCEALHSYSDTGFYPALFILYPVTGVLKNTIIQFLTLNSHI